MLLRFVHVFYSGAWKFFQALFCGNRRLTFYKYYDKIFCYGFVSNLGGRLQLERKIILKKEGGLYMSKWSGIAIAGIWIGIGIVSFGAGQAIKDVAEYGAYATGAVAMVEILKLF